MDTAKEDGHWYSAYANAAERLYGKAEGDLLSAEEDEACIAAANTEVSA